MWLCSPRVCRFAVLCTFGALLAGRPEAALCHILCPVIFSLGGSGFVGQNLVQEFLLRRISVLVYDCAPLTISLPREHDSNTARGHDRCSTSSLLRFVLGDITDQERLTTSLTSFGATCVIHLASWGMSGQGMLSSKCTHINVEGARASVEAAVDSGASTFVYMSTYNVVFHGQEIVQGDERMARSDPSSHTDLYSPSKASSSE